MTEIRWLRLAQFSLLALIALCVLWELLLAPLRPGGSWLVLKVVPLLFLIPGVLKARNYVLQIATLLSWLYVTEGLVRGTSDPATLSALLGLAEAVLAFLLFLGAAMYLRPLKRLAKEKLRESD